MGERAKGQVGAAMDETLAIHATEGSDVQPIDMETFRSRLKALAEIRTDHLNPSDASVLDSKKLIEEWNIEFQGRLKQIESDELNVSNLGPEHLEEYLEQLRKEVSSTEDENMRISGEIGTLTKAVAEESAVLDGDLEAMASLLESADSQGLHYIQAGVQYSSSIAEERCGNLEHASEGYKFEIWELDQQIEKSKSNLSDLQKLDYVFRRIETIGQIEDILSEAKVIEFQGNCIRLSLKTPIPISDGLLRHKLNCLKESLVLDHELLIEVDSSMDLKHVEIFPGDIPLHEIVDTYKASRHLSIPMSGSSLGWLLRQIQYQILLCSLRRFVLKDATKCRHSFEYSDKDDTITAHMVGGIDAFIKVSLGWPISSSALHLVSVRSSDVNSKSVSLSFLCKVKELANSLDVQKRRDLASFLDAIEELLIREMHSELHSVNTCT